MNISNRTFTAFSICIFLFTCLNSLYSISFTDGFRQLNMKNGLANDIISCIYQDQKGFMWFGTKEGLSKYDGVQVRNFSLNNKDLIFQVIDETSDEKLWIVVNKSVYCFDRKIEKFIPVAYRHNGEKVFANDLKIAADSLFWIIDRNRLLQIKRKYGSDASGNTLKVEISIEKQFTTLLNKTSRFERLCYSADRKYLQLITSDGRILFFDPASQRVVSDRKIPFMSTKKYFEISSVNSNQEYIWVTTIGQGLFRIHIKTWKTDHFVYHPEQDKSTLSHTDAYNIMEIDDNTYLAITWNGYTLFMPDKNDQSKMIHNIYNNIAFSNYRNLETRMISSFCSSNGILWIGTNGGGVIYKDIKQNDFKQYNSKRHNAIYAQISDPDNRIWLGTFHEGIMRSTSPFTNSAELEFSTIKEDKYPILCAIKDPQNNMWFGNAGGDLILYEWSSKGFYTYPLKSLGVNTKLNIQSLLIDKHNRFWVGTDDGLFLFNTSRKDFKKINLSNLQQGNPLSINSMIEDKKHQIWLGTNIGVIKLENKGVSLLVKSGYYKREDIDVKDVNSLLAAPDGTLYIGYDKGLGVIPVNKNRVTEFYTTKDGLCSNEINNIIMDTNGDIWLGTVSAISRFKPIQKIFYNYYISGSNYSALLLDKTLFWGNNKSLTYFKPSSIRSSFNAKHVSLVGLELNNKLVNPGDTINNQVVLTKNISYTTKIELNDRNHNFSILFSNLKYADEQCKYACRLYPYQKNWYITESGSATYSNLRAGDYVFEVKLLYPDQPEGDVTQLSITLIPHWSKTLTFRLFLLFCCSLLISYIVYWLRAKSVRRKKLLELKHALLAAEIDRDKEKQIKEAKERFFTTSAHELRTPLTLILSPLHEIIKHIEPSNSLYGSLSVMYRSCTELSILVDRLLYIQKIEAGMIKLQLSEWDITKTIRKQAAYFNQIAIINNCEFILNLKTECLHLWIDVEKIESAISNLLSNAFKYTARNGKIELSLEQKDINGKSYCLISVKDNGIGIPEELQTTIFNSFTTGVYPPQFSTSMGLGLNITKNTMLLHHGEISLDSRVGYGSCFVLYIPEGRSHFETDNCDWIIYEPEEDLHKIEVCNRPTMEAHNETGSKTSNGKLTLLIIEDNEEMRNYLCSLFRDNYTVIEAPDGKSGVDMAEKHIPQLIISDIMMPVMDGFEFCKEMQKNKKLFHIPIILLSAKAEDEDQLNGLRSGIDDYMMKPFNPDLLQEKVRCLIEQRKRLKQFYTQQLMLNPNTSTVKDETADLFIQELIGIIEENLTNENFSVMLLAEKLHMSQSSLYRKVKQKTDLNIIEIIRGVRLNKAASLIIKQQYSVQEISEMVGFESVNIFRKHFVSQFGVLPSKYNNEVNRV